MNTFLFRYIASLFLAMVFFSSAWAYDIEVNAVVDRSEIYVGEEIVYALYVKGPFSSLESPIIPIFKGFTSRNLGQKITRINGDGEATYRYLLTAEVPGTYTITPSTVIVNGERFRSNSLEVTVLDGANPNSSRVVPVANPNAPPSLLSIQNQRGPAASADVAFVTMDTDKKEAYINEQITLTFRFYRRVSLVEQEIFKAPSLEGFRKVDVLPNKMYTDYVKNQEYIVKEITTALFPLRAGDLEIGPATLECLLSDSGIAQRRLFGLSMMMSSGTGRPARLRAEGIAVHVKDLPKEGQPKDFNGVVGYFKMKAVLDKTDVNVGEAVNLKITVAGQGLLKGVAAPVLNVPGLQIYTSDSQYDQVEKPEIWSKNIYDIVLIPQKAGAITIPPLTFSYFDLKETKFKTIESEPMTLNVAAVPGQATAGASNAAVVDYAPQTPSGAELNMPAESKLLYLKTSLGCNEGLLQKYPRFFMALWLLLWPLLWIVAKVVLKIKKAQFANASARRYKQASAEAKNILVQAHAHMKKNQQEQAYGALSLALRTYVAARSERSAQGLTRQDIQEIMQHKCSDPSLGEELLALMDDLDHKSFGVAKADHPAEDYHKVAQMLKRIEKVL